MKKLIVAFLFCSPVFLFGQTTKKMTLVGSVDLSYRVLKNEEVLLIPRDEETMRLNYHFNANYLVKLRKNLWLRAGVGYASLGYNGKKITGIRWGSEHDGNGNYVFNPELNHEFQPRYDFRFLEIPIALQMEFSEKKFKPFVELGVVPMFYLNSRIKQELERDFSIQVIKNNMIGDFHFLAIFSTGFNYQLNEKFGITVQPNARFNINKLVNAPVSEHLWSVGIGVGGIWNLD